MAEWKPIKGFKGKYHVSSTGKVKNSSGKIMKQRKDRYGYSRLELYKKGEGHKCLRIHSLVAGAFLKRKKGQTTVNHKHKNKDHNSVSKLEWMSQKDNIAHQHTYKVNKHIRKRKNGASAVRQHKRTTK